MGNTFLVLFMLAVVCCGRGFVGNRQGYPHVHGSLASADEPLAFVLDATEQDGAVEDLASSCRPLLAEADRLALQRGADIDDGPAL